ncbi:MAG: glycoside hydrolase family 3 N-terminal domain-containing protein [Rickettsiaceae bacterium]
MSYLCPIIIGISGPKLNAKEIELFSKHIVFGFILFSRNIESSEQLKDLVTDLKSLYNGKHTPLIFIDQEGGRVRRLKPPIISRDYSPAKYFSDLYNPRAKDIAIDKVRAHYISIMNDLNSFGIDSPCAPVADLHFEHTHDVIGDRSFGGDVDQVVDLCNASIDAIVSTNGIPIIKHIPGHGRARSDSHLSLPIIDTNIKELNRTDFDVFRKLVKNPNLDYAMTAHIVYTALDIDNPITTSVDAIEYIRHSIGFKGKIISDDIGMLALHGGIGAKYFNSRNPINPVDPLVMQGKKCHFEFIQSLCNIASQSLNAGCDILCHCSGNIEEMQAILTNI